MATRMKVKKGDQVMVISGKDKGKKGRVIEVLTRKRKVLVEGLNILKHHLRQNRREASPAASSSVRLRLTCRT